MQGVQRYLITLSLGFFSSLMLTLAVRPVARRAGWVAKPRPDRWHRKPTALYGGIGIYGGFLLAYPADRPAEIPGAPNLVVCSPGELSPGPAHDRFQPN